MTLVQLRHFVVLARLGSYVQASKELFVTQSALSRSIQSLEDELGQPLFDRLGRRTEPTPFGRDVLQRAQGLVNDADALRQLGRDLHTGQTGKLRLGLSSAPGALLTRPLLLHMAEHHPRLQLEISRGNTDVLLQSLQAQQLDGAIVDIRAMRPSSVLRVTQAFALPASFMVRPGHPLTGANRAVTLADIRAYPIASTPLSDEVARLLQERYGAEANPDDMVTLRCDETLSLVEATRHSNAVLLTVNAVGAGLVQLPVSPPLNASARFGLVTLNHRQESTALHIVREQLPRWIQALDSAASPG